MSPAMAMFFPTTVRHPAKFSSSILDLLTVLVRKEAERLERLPMILDPFAGTGRVHSLPGVTYGVELEPEWAFQHPRTVVGDALDLPWPDDMFDVLCTSPCYGNRMADHHEARDSSRRNTYRHALGRQLTKGNAGAMQWGDEYREFHHKAWLEAARVLRPGALVLLNVSNHIRKGKEQPVVEWHAAEWWLWHAAAPEKVHEIKTPRQRQGANGHVRVGFETVLEMRLP